VSSQDPITPKHPAGRAGVAFLLGLAVGGFSVYYLLWRTGALVEGHPASRRPLFDLLGSRATQSPPPMPTATPTPPPALAPSPVVPSLAPEPSPSPAPTP
jgi:hypothetical protein